MNIIYLLENLDKKEEEKRFYIGSKAECKLIEEDGIFVIHNLKNNKKYYGSSSNLEMITDINNKNRFSAKILEKVASTKLLREAEEKHIKLHNAVESSEYYNMSYPSTHCYMVDQQNTLYNEFGETVLEYGKRMSSANKVINNIITLGFKTPLDYYNKIKELREQGKSFREIALNIKSKNRHNIQRFLEATELETLPGLFLDLDKKEKVIFLYRKAASFKKIAEITNLNIVVVYSLLTDFVKNKKFIASGKLNLEKSELEIKMLKLVVEGKTIAQASDYLNITITSGYRYFYRGLRERLKSNDL